MADEEPCMWAFKHASLQLRDQLAMLKYSAPPPCRNKLILPGREEKRDFFRVTPWMTESKTQSLEASLSVACQLEKLCIQHRGPTMEERVRNSTLWHPSRLPLPPKPRALQENCGPGWAAGPLQCPSTLCLWTDQSTLLILSFLEGKLVTWTSLKNC